MNSPTSPQSVVERNEDDLPKEDVENVVVESPAEVPAAAASKDPELPATSPAKKSLKVQWHLY